MTPEQKVAEGMKLAKNFTKIMAEIREHARSVSNLGGSSYTTTYIDGANLGFTASHYDNFIGSVSAIDDFITTNNHEDNFYIIQG